MGFMLMCIPTLRISNVFTQKELNLRQRKWLELLKYYDMSVIYHLDIDNVVVDALSRMPMGSVTHVEDAKNDLVKMFIGWLICSLIRRLPKWGFDGLS